MLQSQLDDLFSSAADGVAEKISDRLTQELVIALVGPVGSGVTTTAKIITYILRTQYEYDVCQIQQSAIIKKEASRVGVYNIPSSPLDEYINIMQNAGNLLREKFGNNYLAYKTVELIHNHRKTAGGFKNDIPLPGRRAYIIDSLKNPEELVALREIYGETLCVFGVFAPDAIRSQRLKDNGAVASSVDKIMDRDKGEIATFGQKTRKVFVKSDFFICNDKKTEELTNTVVRFLALIFCTTIHTPTRSESAMYEAMAASANSACMSRQVGATIISESGELIAVGWNDVPKFGGGLYCEDQRSVFSAQKGGMIDQDNRCFNWESGTCHNDALKSEIINTIINTLRNEKILSKKEKIDRTKEILQKSSLSSIIEYSRAIHAEMEAILSVAREGRHSLNGSTLYTTTYPCHNCARHIVSSGISKVIYIDPYEKSLAIRLHHDAITEDPEDISRVIFRQYDGVAPTRYFRLFHPAWERKRASKVLKTDPKQATPIFKIPLDSPIQYESKVISELTRHENLSE